jgi:hypothetical protein
VVQITHSSAAPTVVHIAVENREGASLTAAAPKQVEATKADALVEELVELLKVFLSIEFRYFFIRSTE